MTNQPKSISKPSEDISTPAFDHNSPSIKPCTFCHFDQNQIQEINEEKPEQHPETTMLDKIMAAVQIENTNLNVTQALINGVLQLSETIEFLKREVKHLEHKIQKIGLEKKQSQSKRKRRKAVDLQKNYICPYRSCLKSYASDISLNLHVRLKHKNSEIEKQNHRKASLTHHTAESTEAKFQLPPQILKGVQSEYSRLLLENQHQQ